MLEHRRDLVGTCMLVAEYEIASLSCARIGVAIGTAM